MRMLQAENLGGVLISSQHNFSWLSAGAANGIDLSRDPGAGALLVCSDGKRYVLANRIEMPRLLAEEISLGDFEPVVFGWEEEKSPSFLSAQAGMLLPASSELGVDLAVDSGTRVIEGAISRCRFELTASEIDRYRALGKDAAQVLGSLMKTLSPGQTEQEVARQMTHELAARNIRAVVALVAGDERIKKFRHPVPTDQSWEKVLMVVVCARRSGLIASLTRFLCVGSVPDELRRRTLATARVNADLLAATRPGATGHELYQVVAQSYAAEGFPGEERLHHQGGACGYRTRDWVAHPLSDDRVLISQAFAWNPSITGAKVEETCIVSDESVETITADPDWPSLSITSGGREYRFPDVLTR